MAVDLQLPVARDELTLGRFLAQVAARWQDREALVLGDRRVTYTDLERDARTIGRALVACGVTKGTRVALLMGNRPEFVAAFYGAATLGAVLVPVNTYGTAEDIDYILRHSDASVVLAQPVLAGHHYLQDLFDRHPGLRDATSGAFADPDLPQLRRVVALADDPPAPFEPWSAFLHRGGGVSDSLLEALEGEVHPTDEAMVLYTSGTSARPKAVLHHHQAAVAQNWRWAQQLGFSPRDRIWSSYPFFWTAGLSFVLGGTLASGACLVLQEVFEPGEALELIEREKVTGTHAWPHISQQLAEHPDAAKRDLSSLVYLSPGNALRRFAPRAEANWDPQGAYGLTETFTIATSLPADSPQELKEQTHGRPLPGMDIRIADPHTGETLPTGAIGEIAVRGVTLMMGYYKTFPDEYLDEQGYFRTGDSGFFDEDGYLHWAGRTDGLIKCGGANVAPVEIDERVRGWARLRLGHAVGVPHPTLGEAVVLCAVRRDDDPVTEDEVREFLRERLASYKVPRRVLFLDQDELEFTANDKVRAEELRQLAARRIGADGVDPEWAAHLGQS